VRALLRRSALLVPDDSTVTTASGLKIDAASRRVHLGDREIALTAKEFDVLAVLANSHDKVVPRETLMNEVWDQNWYGSTKTLDVTIGRLRSKLEAAAAGEKVVAIRGVGFRLETGT
jgi:DNA-binding response OmpR family regulator